MISFPGTPLRLSYRWLLFLLLFSGMMKNAKSKQVELCTTITLPFNELEPIDVSLQRASAPG
jgi:hypothetical protein